MKHSNIFAKKTITEKVNLNDEFGATNNPVVEWKARISDYALKAAGVCRISDRSEWSAMSLSKQPITADCQVNLQMICHPWVCVSAYSRERTFITPLTFTLVVTFWAVIKLINITGFHLFTKSTYLGFWTSKYWLTISRYCVFKNVDFFSDF